jgi:protein-S-isoprenylcysteine O-methyltransferase Ste14
VGLVILLWSFWDFIYAGRGTPLPLDPPKFLVARGPYRFVRNPMYVGVELILLGESLLFESAILVIYALAAGAFFHHFVVLYEERTLRRKFGNRYAEYCRAVPRWLPRFRQGPT